MDIKTDNNGILSVKINSLNDNRTKITKMESLESIITNLLQNLNITKYEWEHVSREITARYNDLSENIELPKLKEEE